MQIAEYDIALCIETLDSHVMKDFVDNLDTVFSLAESSDGFVWRCKADEDAAESYLIDGDPLHSPGTTGHRPDQRQTRHLAVPRLRDHALRSALRFLQLRLLLRGRRLWWLLFLLLYLLILLGYPLFYLWLLKPHRRPRVHSYFVSEFALHR